LSLRHNIRRAIHRLLGLMASVRFAGAEGLRSEGFPRIVRLRGGTVRLGRNVKLHRKLLLHLYTPFALVEIGDDTYLNEDCRLYCFDRISIGKSCAIAWGVHMTDSNHHELDDVPKTLPITIGDGVWIGARVTILPGVTIGDGAIVGAGSVVANDIPPRSLCLGTPARVVRQGVEWR
jgi:acetyltransferase-like isoleucine patch superfamily enzyme